MITNTSYVKSSLKPIDGVLSRYSKSCGWVLCVGAGISQGVFPSWNELASSLLAKTSHKCSKLALQRFLALFGPEALMQVVQNEGLAEGVFVGRLSEELYLPLERRFGADWKIVLKGLASSRPGNLTRDEWLLFRDRIAGCKNPTSLGLASVVASTAQTELQPSAIVNFNAEPLLYALINCEYGLSNPGSLARDGVKILDRLSHDLAGRTKGRIPCYHIHGLVPISGARSGFNKGIAPEKLVFTEAQYLSLSRSSYSWQSATFLSACIQHRFVFVGLSFSDPNLRRWLAWEHGGRTDQRIKRGLPTHRHSHFWITRKVKRQSKAERLLIESSVAHLGVRVVWIDQWSEVAPTLRRMLADEKK